MVNKVLFSSNSDEWETPQHIFDLLDKEFHFTLDPCCSLNNKKCNKFFTIEDDGLSKSWCNEVVFCNPPYSRVSFWVKKAYLEHLLNGTIVVMLLPSRTDTLWFHNYIYNYASIRFIKGRLHFNNSKNSAPFGSMIVIFK